MDVWWVSETCLSNLRVCAFSLNACLMFFILVRNFSNMEHFKHRLVFRKVFWWRLRKMLLRQNNKKQTNKIVRDTPFKVQGKSPSLRLTEIYRWRSRLLTLCIIAAMLVGQEITGSSPYCRSWKEWATPGRESLGKTANALAKNRVRLRVRVEALCCPGVINADNNDDYSHLWLINLIDMKHFQIFIKM